MSVFTSAGILILSMLIMAFLQLAPSVFLLFSHYSYGKYSRKNTSNASLFFILGAETSTALIFILLYIAMSSLYIAPAFTDNLLGWLVAGIMIAIGIIFPFCYFRKGRGTKLFISRRLAKEFNYKAKTVKTRSDAFILGFISSLPELIFSFPVYIIAILEIMQIGDLAIIRAILSLCFILIKITPLITIHITMDRGYNLVNIQKTRVANKQFIRFFTSLTYILIGILIIIFGFFSL